MIVTSANEHKGNIPLLQTVDDKDNKIEWITSVSLPSEGWDVKNVFQIVPQEERTFNAKLLIAQVLGRELRINRMTAFLLEDFVLKIPSSCLSFLDTLPSTMIFF